MDTTTRACAYGRQQPFPWVVLTVIALLATSIGHAAEAGTWTSKAEKPTPLPGLAAATVGGLIYAVGAGPGPFVAFEAYDPVSNSWSARAPMPVDYTEDFALGAVGLGGKLYVRYQRWFGGHALLEYDPASNSWAVKADVPQSRLGSAMVAANGKIYVIGGYVGAGTPVGTVMAYDPATDSWESKSPMPTPRSQFGAVAVDGIIYAIGGSDYANVEAYDPLTDSWTVKTALPATRSRMAIAGIGRKIYVISGAVGPAVTQDVAVYDTVADSWSTGDPIPTGRWFGSAAVAGSVIHVLGAGPHQAYVPDLAPTSDAGEDQTVDEGVQVTLDGSGSNDPQGDPLTYSWTQVAGPPVTLGLADPVRPTFAAPYVNSNVTLTFELVVDDGIDFSDPDTVDVTVVNVNHPPVADAGDDSTIKEGAVATLDGGFSYDPENDPIAYAWTQVAGPPVTLQPSASVAQPTFVAPIAAGQALVFKLQVSDGKEASVPSPGADSSFADTVAVEVVLNSAPNADAGADQTRDEGTQISLDGTASSDPDGGDLLSYHWSQIGGTPVLLDDATSPVPSFDAPAVAMGGEALSFVLVVSDNDPVNPLSASDDVTINVRNFNDPPSCHLAAPSVGTLWPPNHTMSQVAIIGVMDADSTYNMVTLSIAGVTQDEPVNGLGDGDSSPDAVVQDDPVAETVVLRGERSGTGNGRVYKVAFTATDGFESCDGSVLVTVPHSRNSTPVDDGQAHDSTQP